MLFKNKYPKLLASSIDPYKLSLTVKGILTALVPLVLILAPQFNLDVTQEDFDQFWIAFDNFVSSLQGAIATFIAVISSFMILWGVLRKILVGLKVIRKKAD